ASASGECDEDVLGWLDFQKLKFSIDTIFLCGKLLNIVFNLVCPGFLWTYFFLKYIEYIASTEIVTMFLVSCALLFIFVLVFSSNLVSCALLFIFVLVFSSKFWIMRNHATQLNRGYAKRAVNPLL
ncbi:hypothetical protein ACJX0J_033008, partial [Zea mays]